MEIMSFSIFLVVIFNVFLGFIWYSERCLGPAWLKAYHFKMEQMSPSPLRYLGAIFVSTVIAIVIANLNRILGINSLFGAFKIGFLFWLGFIATTHFSGVIWAKKPLTAYFIDVSYLLLLIVGDVVLFELFSKI